MKKKAAAKKAALGFAALAAKGLDIKRHCADTCYIVTEQGAFVGYVLVDVDRESALWANE